MYWSVFSWWLVFAVIHRVSPPIGVIIVMLVFLIKGSHMATFLGSISLISYMANFLSGILLISDGITLAAASMASRESMGKTIASTRKACGLTQKQVAEQTGINKTTLSEIENGRFTGSLDIFERYLDAVGLQLELTTKQHRLPGWDEVDKLFAEDE
ncbi:hypothetical protein Dda3937_02160 [Dickeya dadantii 3937]|uniref:HTH cro/C1-type domain-containing protein n=2 Tax=Dickeya dadantii TaxID=204038 RepID=E0SI14_DICD3|nr:hypothetical protein Dda3937_02160 [Dickeya dadantii 3937]